MGTYYSSIRADKEFLNALIKTLGWTLPAVHPAAEEGIAILCILIKDVS